jgi:hypothetical protein
MDDYLELLGRVPADALNSPTRSVVPLLEFWRDPESRLHELGATLGIELQPPVDLIFEYSVPVQKGRGNASFSDLMVLSEDAAIAIEAKYTELQYESVASWLGGEPTDNRLAVLDGWLRLINRRTASALSQESVLDLPYQLVHRAASACFPTKAKSALVYLVFGGDPATHYSKHLAQLASLLADRSRLSIRLLRCSLTGSDIHREQVTRWKNGERTLAASVRKALAAAPVFVFDRIEGAAF